MKTPKLYLLCALALCCLLSACETVSYLGDKYPAKQNVDVFYDVHDIKREYKVIGHMSGGVAGGDEEQAKNDMIAKAKVIGADAVVFHGLAFTGGKDSTPYEKADAIKYLDGKQEEMVTEKKEETN